MERTAYFDNARVLLIFLVVFGHMIQPFTGDSPWIHTLYVWIYTFHMPAFILLAGLFAKGAGNKDYIFKLTRKLLLPYFIFQMIYTIYYFFIGKEDWQAGIFYPQWSLWFLFSLFSWHILLILFKKIPAVYGLAISLTAGILAGYFGDIGHTFSLSRTIVFFPFFLSGYWLTQKQVLAVTRRRIKVVSIIIMIAVAASLYIAPDINTGWLLASKSYIDLGMVEYGGIARLFIYLLASIMVISILAWVPKRNFGWITNLGRRTIYVYLLHGFIIQFIREYDLFHVAGFFDVVGLAVLSVAIVLLLSSRPLVIISQPFIEGRITMLKHFFSGRKQGHV